MNRRCDQCEFWRIGFGSLGGSKPPHPDDKYGECRRSAPLPHYPVIFQAAGVTRDGSPDTSVDDAVAYWPTTLGVDWCGEYRAREASP